VISSVFSTEIVYVLSSSFPCCTFHLSYPPSNVRINTTQYFYMANDSNCETARFEVLKDALMKS
jgi:hypothetical protein